MKNSTSLLGLCMLLSSTTSFEQAGSLDSTFSADGKVTTGFGTAVSNGRSVAMQADGKIVVAGYSGKPPNYNFALVRYRQGGKPDNSFGTNGKVITDFAGGDDEAYSVTLQADGKIVVAGYAYNGSNNDFALARYKLNGSLDTTFGTNGKVTTDFGADFDQGRSVAIQADGKIVIAGSTLFNNTVDFALARYYPDGKIDSAFGTNGKAIFVFGKSGDQCNSVAIQPDGKIVMAGTSNDQNFALARYRQTGKIDSSFGKDGRLITDFGGQDRGQSVAIQADGKIVVAGMSSLKFSLARYKQNGKIDSAFGTNGKVTTIFDYYDYGYSIAIQIDGKIVVAGSSGFSTDFALARYRYDGELDSAFGTSGKVTTDFGNYDVGYSVAIQVDGKIVVAGTSYSVFAVARYKGDSTPAMHSKNNNFSNLQKQNNITSYNIHLSPNPVKNILYVQGLSSSTKTISILDAKGKLLHQATTSNSSYSFNVKRLSAGMYFVRSDLGEKTTTLKFIKE